MIQLVKWSFHGIEVPMISYEGDLYCVNKALVQMLGCNTNYLQRTLRNNLKEFELLRPSSGWSKEELLNFIRQNKSIFGISRVKEDLNIWSEDEVFTFAFLSRTDRAIQCRTEFRIFLKQHRTISVVSIEQYNKLIEENKQLNTRTTALEEMVMRLVHPMDRAASNAGRTLGAFRGTRDLRDNFKNLH